MNMTTTTRPVTPAQQGYLTDLLAKIANPAVQEALKADLNTLYANRLLDTREASRQIDRLKAVVAAQQVAQAAAPVAPRGWDSTATPAPVPAVKARPNVATGRYAVEVSGGMRWYFVKNEGGRYTVQRYISDTLTRVRWAEALDALSKIEADPKAAALTFARESVRCYVCARRLTDTTPGGSVDQGIGPDCAAKGLGF